MLLLLPFPRTATGFNLKDSLGRVANITTYNTVGGASIAHTISSVRMRGWAVVFDHPRLSFLCGKAVLSHFTTLLRASSDYFRCWCMP